MKCIYMILGLLLTFGCFAQDKQTKIADQLFESRQYAAAIDAYENLINKGKTGTYVYKRLADSYYNVSNIDKAALYYSKATATKQDAETYFNYAQTLKSQGKYQEAKQQMDMFASLLPNDQRTKDHIANPDYITALESLPAYFDVKEVTVNTKTSSDFAGLLTNEGLVYFVSTRNDGNKTDTWSGTPYLDIYQAEYTNGALTEPQPVAELNTNYHDGPVTVSSDGKTMYFSRDGLVSGDIEKRKETNTKMGKLGIYRAERKDDKWGNITPLPFNSTKYSVGNPSLSQDGKTLYFASDMPGGLGDTDIWKVSINKGKYGKPENLGKSINTAGKESFPFIADDGMLYFASNGKQGFGGFDVFKADLNSNQEAENLGKPVNSKKDDFAFTFNMVQNIGFLSSNRAGLDNIYSVHPNCLGGANIVIADAETGKRLQGAKVSILENDVVLKTEESSVNGNVIFKSDCNKLYKVQADLQDYKPQVVALEISENGIENMEILLQPIEVVEVTITDKEVLLDPIFFAFNKSDITQQGAEELNKLVTVMNNYPKMEILVKSHTDSKGSASYNLSLSEKRAQATVDYIVSKGISKNRISGQGFGESEPKIDCGDDCTKEQDAQNRRSEFLIVKQ